MLGQSGMKIGALSDQFIEGEGGEPARSYLQRESGQQYKESMAEMNKLNNLMKLMKLQQEGQFKGAELGLKGRALGLKEKEAKTKIAAKNLPYDQNIFNKAVQISLKNADLNTKAGLFGEEQTTDPAEIYEYLYTNQYKTPSSVSNKTQQSSDWESFKK